MKMKRLLTFFGLLLAVSFCAAAMATSKPNEYSLWLQASITIDKEGHLSKLEWQTTKPGNRLITDRITPAIKLWEFVPGSVNGQATETTSGLLVDLRATENSDGSYALRIMDAKTGPLIIHGDGVSYPIEALGGDIGAAVMAYVAVSPDGKATVERMEFAGSSGNDYQTFFLKVVKDSIAKWTFEPERVGGLGVTTHVEIPVSFCTDASRDWCRRRIASDRKDRPANLPVATDSAVAIKTDIRDLKI
jgi:hypothetical protein